MSLNPVVVVGAGPAGLTAAYELSKHQRPAVVLESGDRVGGISRTETYKDYRFDIGGHRFYTKVTEVEDLWQEVLSDEMITVPRLSRIYYDGKFFNYPLDPFDVVKKLGIGRSLSIVASYLKARLSPLPEEESLEDWVINRFGEKLYYTFFKTYTEKVWGISCQQIRADWAAQRIRGLSLKKAITDALFGKSDAKTLIKTFQYPRLGPGMMWERFQTLLEKQGSPVHLNTRVVQIDREGQRIQRVIAEQNGETQIYEGDQFISSMPVTKLLQCLNPPPPPEVLTAAKSLKYRDFLIVALVIDAPSLFPDNWLYIHSPEFQVGRIQNFKNWSPDMVPDASKTCLGMEYFCSQGDSVWESSEETLIKLATEEVVKLGLVSDPKLVQDGTVIRQLKAYPVYDVEYRQHLQVIQDYVETFDNLYTVGRNGMHRYNNQDHSMLTGLLAARNVLGDRHSLWTVNTERSYYEEFQQSGSGSPDVASVSNQLKFS
ncbi:NAD(P)/FAD-dependent oxidoreductase [Leptolyngbya sp. CCY15150]|uniref:NAD(P)/FAD-dependent oxidoreductase n=1 Tax=Leptolyngbya sp. CCY15150 TaxID=2767772 RepID=UPI00194FAB1F|nr:NAD(P)/FAD-dependent oxidoreductase [Leptolyngbya sp. CCY15150]